MKNRSNYDCITYLLRTYAARSRTLTVGLKFIYYNILKGLYEE